MLWTLLCQRVRLRIPIRLKHNLLPADDDESWLSETRTVHNSLLTARSVTSANIENYLEIANPTFRDVKIGRGANLGYAVKMGFIDNSVGANVNFDIKVIFAVTTDTDETSSFGQQKLFKDECTVLRICFSTDHRYCPSETTVAKTDQHNFSTILETSVVSEGDVTRVADKLSSQDADNDDELRSLVQKLINTIT